YPTWDIERIRPYYKLNQHERLAKAIRINETAALKSASWGAFQIMGFNHEKCGFKSVQEFVKAMEKDEYSQLDSFCKYLCATHLDVNLKNLDWKGFARGYNGPDYVKNQYDTKLAKAYQTYNV
ncbi:MAG: N-acetylmuramidase family protein, partial [Pedobacter sp.]